MRAAQRRARINCVQFIIGRFHTGGTVLVFGGRSCIGPPCLGVGSLHMPVQSPSAVQSPHRQSVSRVQSALSACHLLHPRGASCFSSGSASAFLVLGCVVASPETQPSSLQKKRTLVWEIAHRDLSCIIISTKRSQ